MMMQRYSRAMQTAFHGTRYKSRAEARWAVFFWTLQIPYEYEPEGFVFDAEKVTYLPDFYLPEQDCFVEIKSISKGETPTLSYPRPKDEDIQKAALLNECWGKDVFLFYEIPDPAAPKGITQGRGAIAWTQKTRKQGIFEKDVPQSYKEEYLRGEKELIPFDYGYYWTQCPNGYCRNVDPFGITKGGRADLLPCNCSLKLYAEMISFCDDWLSADEMKLVWRWMTHRHSTPPLVRAYNNARGAYFNSGKAWEGHSEYKVPIKSTIDYPVTSSKWELLVCLNEALIASDQKNASQDDAERSEQTHAILTEAMQEINWYSIREVKEELL
ncbi:MAG: hypothetical protein ACXV7G_14100 [Halobacteriota archaeon]